MLHIPAFLALPTTNIVDNLSTGYAVSTRSVGTSQVVFEFWKGTYAGKDSYLTYYEDRETTEVAGVRKALAQPVQLLESVPVSTIEELQDWALDTPTFGDYFSIRNMMVTGNDGEFDTTMDATSLSLDSGEAIEFAEDSRGTETYTMGYLRDALVALEGEDIDFILSDAIVTKDPTAAIKNNLISSAIPTRYADLPTMYIGGADDNRAFDTSIAEAVSWNSPAIKLIHGGVRDPSTGARGGLKFYNSLYHAALICGMDAGREPQQGLTFQAVPIRGLIHNPTQDEERRAIDSGVFIVRQEDGFRVVNDINTLQANKAVYAQNASYLAQIRKIARALRKELKNILSTRFQKGAITSNVNLVSDAAVTSAGATYLSSRIANDTVDSYLITFDSPRTVRRGPISTFSANVQLNIPSQFILVDLTVSV